MRDDMKIMPADGWNHLPCREKQYITDLGRTKKGMFYSFFRHSTPYGVWTLEGGTWVIFNRDYVPIWVWELDKPARTTRPHWVTDYVKQQYFWGAPHFFNVDRVEGQRHALLLHTWIMLGNRAQLTEEIRK